MKPEIVPIRYIAYLAFREHNPGFVATSGEAMKFERRMRKDFRNGKWKHHPLFNKFKK